MAGDTGSSDLRCVFDPEINIDINFWVSLLTPQEIIGANINKATSLVVFVHIYCHHTNQQLIILVSGCEVVNSISIRSDGTKLECNRLHHASAKLVLVVIVEKSYLQHRSGLLPAIRK